MSFENLKRNRDQISKLVQAAEAAGGSAPAEKKNYGDDRIWKPTVDKAGNGYAVLRFLPATEGVELPWVRYWDHGFKGPTGQWYIENSLTSIGQADPVGELNSRLWNSGIEADKETARRQKRRLHYVANVLVVSDPGNPSNEGKVMLYKFGKKIFEKIMDAMQPDFADEKPVNPFDMWEGADFTVKIRKVEGYPNYDASSFKSPAALPGSDEELEALYNKQYDLTEWTDPTNYKTYDELKARLALVLGESAPRTQKQEASLELDDEIPDFPKAAASAPASAPAPAVATAEAASEDDDTMSYFAKLAADD